MLRALLVGGGVAIYFLAAPVHAYVQARDHASRPTHWYGPSVELRLYVAPNQRAHAKQALEALENAAQQWETASGLQFSVRLATWQRTLLAEDGINAVVFHSNFCQGQLVPQKDCRGRGPAAHAMTYPYSRAAAEQKSAEIIEADIEVNASRFADLDRTATRRLEAVFLHEIGHLLGLDHVCRATRLGDERDYRGARIPPCSDGPASVLDTVMYPDPLHERFGGHLTLGEDELLAMRDVYGAPPPGRSAGWVKGGKLAALLLAVAVGLWLWLRRGAWLRRPALRR